MEAKDVIDVEQRISQIIGKECHFEFIRYDGAKRIEVNKSQDQSDGFLRDNLGNLPGYYNFDYYLYLKAPEDGNYIAYMRQYQLPGCCGVAVSSGVHVSYLCRNRGINTILNKFRIELAKHMGYSVLMCSDIDSNEPSKRTLARNGWKDIYHFKNRRTNNTVNISIVSLL